MSHALWHRRFGHLNFNSLKMLCQRKMVQGLPNTIEEKNEVCDGCALGKHHRQSFPKGVAWRAKKHFNFITSRIPRSVPLSPSIESPTSSSSSPSSTPRKMRSLTDVYERCNLCIVEPQSFEEAIKDEDWRKAMEKEIDVIEKNETWQLVEKPKDKEIIGPGVDFHETFAPVARLDTIRTIIAVAAQKGWLLYQLDIKSAFLNGKLEEEIYVEQPQGFVVDGEENKVYKLKKALYGLKQAPRAWYTQIDSYFIENGFIRSKSEPTLYVKSKDNSQILIVALYVDDLIFTGNDEKMVEKFRNEMMKKYEMSDMGLLHYFLGIEVYQEEDGVFICQKRTRHIAVKYHFIKEVISDGEVQLMYCKSEEQVADIFTKALPLEKLVHFRKLLGVEEHHIRGRM
ncbi:Retrovirus-related Pol polyprotein from transposon RE1 [Vitis vinifera]|uniref:Retrovirus-related Pol polyprotein from transposon RE1 n=1 Tax=Vitis vinifera TaxID=29760 RepID=A0A438FE60_VITVI|nr:Retrovirus-related Pol polyprotein from transposon RE1 [Vitis vinifera]